MARGIINASLLVHGFMRAWPDLMSRQISSIIEGFVESNSVAGAAVGIWHKGNVWTCASGTANLNSGLSMQVDTRWLLGSVTKVLTAQLVLSYQANGLLDIDAPIITYLPDFTLTDMDAARAITLRQCISHANGIDSDTYAPHTDDFLGASQHYISGLSQVGTLFAPGQSVHYSNPGFIIAARVLEVLTGRNFNRLLEDDLFAALGMDGATCNVEEAVLHNLAIGAFANDSGGLRPTDHFMSEACGAGAGTTAIVTIDDMLRFASLHLPASQDAALLSPAIVEAMQTPQLNEARVGGVLPGLGWWIDEVGGCRTLSHAGGSPGGVSQLVLAPDLDFAIISFATGPGVIDLHDQVLLAALEDAAGNLAFAKPSKWSGSLDDYVGIYGGFQSQHDVQVSGSGLTLVSSVPPFDDEHDGFLRRYYGGLPQPVTRQLVPFGEDLFIVEGSDRSAINGLLGRGCLYGFERDEGGGIVGMRNGARYSQRGRIANV